MSRSRQDRLHALVLAGILAAGLAGRCAYRAHDLDDADSARFVQAVERFRVADWRPQPPGYPVFVVLTKGARLVTGDPLAAVAWVSAIAGGLAPLPLYFLARGVAGAGAGLVAAALVAVAPTSWLAAEQLHSDTTGLAALLVALALLVAGLRGERGRLVVAGAAVLGLTLGVRLSYFPFVASAAWLVGADGRRHARLATIAFLVGVAAWLLPLLAHEGTSALAGASVAQARGHFGRWGGTLVTEPGLPRRLLALIDGLGLAAFGLAPSGHSGWGLAALGGALAGLVGLGLARPSRLARTLLVLAVPYLVWLLVGQNVIHRPRHLLPLVALAAVALAYGVASLPRPAASIATVLLLVGAAHAGLDLARRNASSASPAVTLARSVAASRAPLVYTRMYGSHLATYAPATSIALVERVSQARADFFARSEPEEALVTSDVGGADRGLLEPIATFERDADLGLPNRLALYRLRR